MKIGCEDAGQVREVGTAAPGLEPQQPPPPPQQQQQQQQDGALLAASEQARLSRDSEALHASVQALHVELTAVRRELGELKTDNELLRAERAQAGKQLVDERAERAQVDATNAASLDQLHRMYGNHVDRLQRALADESHRLAVAREEVCALSGGELSKLTNGLADASGTAAAPDASATAAIEDKKRDLVRAALVSAADSHAAERSKDGGAGISGAGEVAAAKEEARMLRARLERAEALLRQVAKRERGEAAARAAGKQPRKASGAGDAPSGVVPMRVREARALKREALASQALAEEMQRRALRAEELLDQVSGIFCFFRPHCIMHAWLCSNHTAWVDSTFAGWFVLQENTVLTLQRQLLV